MRTEYRLAGHCPPHGPLADVRERVAIDTLWYAGSHGFDIAGPAPGRRQYQRGRAYLPALDVAEQRLRRSLASVRNCRVERKRFSVAVHYRQVGTENIAEVKQRTGAIVAAEPELRLSRGKRILELQPAMDWNKGKALRWLMQALDLDPQAALAIYLGDDVTDEDAFRELRQDGIGILVGPAHRSTAATYRLDGPDQVEVFLGGLAARLEQSGR